MNVVLLTNSLFYNTGMPRTIPFFKKLFMSGKIIKRLLSDTDLLHLYLEHTHIDSKRLINTTVNNSRFIVLDTETTGLHAYSGDEIISIAMLEYQGLKPTGNTFEKLINPQRSIPAESTKIHGISNEQVTGCETIQQALPEILSFISDGIIVGHHIQFDIRFLNRTIKPYLGFTLQNPWLDTMLLYLTHEKRLGHYQLEEAAATYNIEIHNRHTALGDAEATAELFTHLAREMTSTESPLFDLRNKQGTYSNL